MKLFDWIKNRFDAQLGRVAILYLCSALLYAILGFFFISKFSSLDETGLGGNRYIIENKVRIYWGLIFGPLFFALTIPVVLKFLKRLNKRDGIEIMLMLWLAYDVIAFIVGAINGNSLKYLFGDTFMLSIIPLSYFFVRNYIKEDKQIKGLFYFMLILQFALLALPVHGFTVLSMAGTYSMGFYTMPGAEIFVAPSLMILATLSKNRWVYMILLIAVLPAMLSRSLGSSNALQIFTVIAIIFSIHITKKGFIKRFATMLLVVFISLSLFWRFGLVEGAVSRYPLVYSKLLETYTGVYNKIKGSVVQEEKAKGIEVPGVKLAQEEKAKGIEVPGVKLAQEEKAKGIEVPGVKLVSVRKIIEVIGEGKYEIESTIKKNGRNSLKLTKINPNPRKHFYARIRILDDYDRFYFGGRKITFGCWVYSPTGEDLVLNISDMDSGGVSSHAYSPEYSGNGKWEFLTVSKGIRSEYEVIELRVLSDYKADYKGGFYYIDGAVIVEGEVAGDVLSTMVNQDNDLFENFEVYAYPAMDQSINQRLYEARVVKEKIKSNLLTFLFGYGNGA